MSIEDMAKRILANVPDHAVDHNTLWHLCGRPADAESYAFDFALCALADAGEILCERSDRGMRYRRVAAG